MSQTERPNNLVQQGRHHLLAASGVLLLSLLAGCASHAGRPSRELPGLTPLQQAAEALRRSDWQTAQTALAAELRDDLPNGYLQFLYALTYEKQAEAGNRAQLEMAQVGYENAVRFTPQNYWAQLHMGYLKLERGDHDAAQDHFAAAALDQPQRWQAFYGLGVASYHRGDLPMVRLAAERSLALAADEPDAQRLAAFSLALQGDNRARVMAANAVSGRGGAGDDGERAFVAKRVDELLSGATLLAQQNVQPQRPSLESTIGQPANELYRSDRQSPVNEAVSQDPDDPSQMVVDVTIILSSQVETQNRGINLFDGLRLQYGYVNTLSQASNTNNTDGFISRINETARAITSQISVPQLSYNLNLFNDARQYYGVIARPSLTAYVGRESEFFAGRTINVAVSGVNLGQLQPVDVGVKLKLAPEAMTQDATRFRIEAARSFLSREEIGRFEQSLTTFKQFVQATAELSFGQTLILSALSEQVSDNSSSQVPYAGDIPGLNALLKNRNNTKRQESLLILVTPSLPMAINLPSDPARRLTNVKELIRYWQQVVDPGSDIGSILKQLPHGQALRRAKPGDLPHHPGGRAERELDDAIEENLRLARRH
jgi:Flp pilus assembly secretin CpaC